MPEASNQFEPGNILIRRADREGGDGKLRPCVVISSSERERDAKAETVLAVPLTSDTDGKQRIPMPVITPDPSNGLVQRSVAMCGRVSCIRKARLDQQIGSVHAQQLRRVRLGVAAVIGLTDLLTTQKPPIIGALQK